MNTSLDAVEPSLGNDPAFVSVVDGTVMIFSEAAVTDPETVAVELSASVRGTVLSFSVTDDQVLACALCIGGELIASVAVPDLDDYAGIDADELELMAEYLGEAIPDGGSTSEPTRFVMGLEIGDRRQALAVLSDSYGDGEPVSATARHRALLQALGLPDAAAGWDYDRFHDEPDAFEGPQPTRLSS